MKKILLGSVIVSTLTTVGAARVELGGVSEPATKVADDSSQARGGGGSEVIHANGLVEGRAPASDLQFEISGRLASLEVRAGQQVTAGTVIARLNSAVQQQELAAAEAQLRIARAEHQRLVNGPSLEERHVAQARVQAAEVDVDQARRAYQRAAKLPESAISQQALDDRLGDVRLAESRLHLAERLCANAIVDTRPDELDISAAKVLLAEARVSQARVLLDQTNLRAPYDGTVTRLHAEAGEMVGPSGNSGPVVTLVDASTLRVRTYVEEFDALRVRVGASVQVQLPGPRDATIRGTVVSCLVDMAEKTNLRNDASERFDVRVRELLVELESQEAAKRLILGLPVDVIISPTPLAGMQDISPQQGFGVLND